MANVTEKQKKARERNWNKWLLVGMINNFNKITQLDSLSFREKVALFKCREIIEKLLKDWKPIL